MASSGSLKIGVYGLDNRARKLLKLFFDGPCQRRFRLVGRPGADVQIVDLDRPGGWEYYREQAAVRPGRPLIGISLQAEPAGQIPYFLRKPLRLDEVLNALQRIGERLGHQIERPTAFQLPSSFAESAPVLSPESLVGPATVEAPRSKGMAATAEALEDDTQKTRFRPRDAQVRASAEAPADLFYAAEDYLQGYFQEAARLAQERQAPVRLSGLWGNLYILPWEKRVYSSLPDARLRPLTVMRTARQDVSLEVTNSRALAHLAAAPDAVVAVTSVETLTWKLALWTSRGRLPRGTDPKIPVILRRWPNFPRLLETPNAMRITALWARQPISLMDTKEALHISQAETFTFYSAAAAIGYAHAGRRQADFLLSPLPIKPRSERRLFRQVLRRLFSP